MANWPRLIWPAQPVSITSETATMHSMITNWVKPTRLLPTMYGNPRKNAATTTAIAPRRMRISRTSRNSCGTGRNSLTACHVDTPVS